MAAELCWLVLAVDLACRISFFFSFFFSFPPSSLEAFGVWWQGFKWVPSNLKALPAFFLLTCCFQACSLWTVATTSHKGVRLSFGIEGPTWKTPVEELACGVKCKSSRWNNPLAARWKCLPRGNSEPGAVRKEDIFPFIISLVFDFRLTKIVHLLLRKNLVWGKTDKSILDRWCCKKRVAEGCCERKRSSGCKARMERGSMSDTGSSKSGRNDVNQPLKWAGELVVHENCVNKKKLGWVCRGFLFPSVALMRVVKLQLRTGHSQRLCSCLSTSWSPLPWCYHSN